jgi:DNA repair exonuclease SbcCD ATPase subunit
MANLSLSIVEIIVLMLGAVFLGITIHFFIVSRRSLKNSGGAGKAGNKDADQWKTRYFNDIESKEKELVALRKKMEEAEQNSSIYSMESDEMRRENKRLQAELDALKKSQPAPAQGNPNFLTQLKQAQDSLLEQNEKIGLLLSQIDVVKENEHKLEEILSVNEELSGQVSDLKQILTEKEKEISQSRQKQQITTEMTSMLDNAYQDFNVLQEKIQKLELQVSTSKMNNLDYENLNESYFKVTEELEAERIQLNGITLQNQQLQLQLNETENKLKEANFQRQQLQKRVNYLEELTKDMQLVADANKKLQTQLKRLGELESMLNVISEERDELMRRQMNPS